MVFGEFLENGNSSDEDKTSDDELQEALGRGQAQPVRGRAPLALRGGIAHGAGRAQPADGTADRGVRGACGGSNGGDRGRGSGFGVLSGFGDQDVHGPAQYPDPIVDFSDLKIQKSDFAVSCHSEYILLSLHYLNGCEDIGFPKN